MELPSKRARVLAIILFLMALMLLFGSTVNVFADGTGKESGAGQSDERVLKDDLWFVMETDHWIRFICWNATPEWYVYVAPLGDNEAWHKVICRTNWQTVAGWNQYPDPPSSWFMHKWFIPTDADGIWIRCPGILHYQYWQSETTGQFETRFLCQEPAVRLYLPVVASQGS